jgi:hypothetical protein
MDENEIYTKREKLAALTEGMLMGFILIEGMFWLIGVPSWEQEIMTLMEWVIGITVCVTTLLLALTTYLQIKDVQSFLFFVGVGFGTLGIMLHGYMLVAAVFGLVVIDILLFVSMLSLPDRRTPLRGMIRLFTRKPAENKIEKTG